MILADEPTGTLDRTTGRRLEEDLVHFARRRRAAVVVVTHNEEWASRADRVISLVDGRIEA
jgi:putative ABC transport system ATP-binding protein